MANLTLERVGLLSLPQELLDHIYSFLHRKDLKALRRSARALSPLATARLFSLFRVYPHLRSFERFNNVADSPHLRHLVTRLDYDARFIGITDRIVKSLQSVWSEQVSASEKEQLIKQARLLDAQKLRAEIQVDNLVQGSHFEYCLSRLTSLQDLMVYDYGNPTQASIDREDFPIFYEQMVQETCGQYPHTKLERGPIGTSHFCMGTYIFAPLVAASKMPRPLQHLTLEGISWFQCLRPGELSKHKIIFEQVLGSLKTLSIWSQDRNHFPDTRSMHNLQALLKTAVSLEKLSLVVRNVSDVLVSGPDLVDDDLGELAHSMFEPAGLEREPQTVPPRLIWSPNLRRLTLVGVNCTLREMKEILKPSVKTLEELHLRNLVLMPERQNSRIERRSAPRACFVALFKWMRRHLSLKSVKLNGRFTNGGLQNWFVGKEHPHPPSSLHTRVREYLTGGDICPLDHVAIKPGHYDLFMKAPEPEIPVEVEADEFHGDESWQMEYLEAFDYDTPPEIAEELDDDYDSLINGDSDPFGYTGLDDVLNDGVIPPISAELEALFDTYT